MFRQSIPLRSASFTEHHPWRFEVTDLHLEYNLATIPHALQCLLLCFDAIMGMFMLQNVFSESVSMKFKGLGTAAK